MPHPPERLEPGSRPDVGARRRLLHRRETLGMDALPQELGVALLASATAARRRMSDWLPQLSIGHHGHHGHHGAAHRHDPLLQEAAHAAVDDFAHLAANRVPPGPPAPAVFHRLGRLEAETGHGLERVGALIATLGGTIAQSAAEHPVATAHLGQLRSRLTLYLHQLHESAATGHRSGHAKPAETGPPEDVLALLHERVSRHWGHVTQVFVTVHGAPGPDAPDSQAPTPATAGHWFDLEPVHLVARDHVTVLHPTRFADTPDQPGASAHVVQIGPVPLHDLTHCYEVSLLVLRLLDLGLATPATTIRCQPNTLDGLPVHLPPVVLHELRSTLQPLLEESPASRVRLARTLHRVLSRPGTHQQHARHLGISSATVRNHLARLRELHGSLDFADRTMPMVTVLQALIPLWELDSRHPTPHLRTTPDPMGAKSRGRAGAGSTLFL